MNRLLKIASAVLGSLIVITACKPSGSLPTSISPLASQAVSPLASPVPPTPNPGDFTPEPRPTLAVPKIVMGTPLKTSEGKSFRLLFTSKDYSGPGEVCDMRPSPDSQAVALYLCNSEGMSRVLIVTDIAKGTAVTSDIVDTSGVKPYEKNTWFRGWFPDSEHILVMSDWLEIQDITTGEHRRLTSEGETVTDAAVSPDGQKIIYTRIQGDVLKIIDTNGNLLKSVSSPTPKPGNRPENLTWSPDGKWVAYTWDQGISYYAGPLWVVDANTGQMKQLSPEGAYDLSPRWSPDSATLLVVRRENVKNSKVDFDPAQWVSDLWTINVGGEKWTQLTHLEGKSAWSPNWTADGSTIVFMSSQSDQTNAWSINLDGTALHQLTTDNSIAPLNLGIVPEAQP